MIKRYNNNTPLEQYYDAPMKGAKSRASKAAQTAGKAEEKQPRDRSTLSGGTAEDGAYDTGVLRPEGRKLSRSPEAQRSDGEKGMSSFDGATIDPFEPNNNVRDTAYKEPVPEKEWTVLVYMAGDNDLEPALVSNLVALEKTGSSGKINIAAELDRGDRPRSTVSRWKGSRRFLVQQSDDIKRVTSPVVQDLGNVNMADPSHLADFIKWGMKSYPAKHYMLIINDHGYGFMGAAVDKGSKHTMSLPEMGEGIRNGVAGAGKKFDIIGFDACLMGQAEVAYELKDSADIMIASQETIGSSGWPYGDLRDTDINKGPSGGSSPGVFRDPTAAHELYFQSSNLGVSAFLGKADDIIEKKGELTPELFAQGIVGQCERHTDATPTMAAIRLGGYMETLADSLKSLALTIQNSSQKEQILEEIKITQRFNLNSPDQNPYGDYRDIYHLCTNLERSATMLDEQVKISASEVKKAVDTAVLDNIATGATPAQYHGANGISLYMPDEVGQTDYGYKQLQFDKATGWFDVMAMVAAPRKELWEPLYEPPENRSGKGDAPEGMA